jgi:hypothetical protein
MKRFALALGAGLALVSAVPATAPAVTKCKSHSVSYVAHGKYVSSSLSPALMPTTTDSPTWSGTLTIKLTSANHHFKSAENVKIVHKSNGVQLFTFTVTNAKVSFSSVVQKQGLKGGDHVTLTGRLIVRSGSGCLAPAKTVNIRHVYVSSKTGK